MPLKMHPDETLTPRERIETTLTLKEPDRVPFVPAFHCAPGLLTGMTLEEYFFNIPKSFEAVKKVWEMFGGFDAYTGCSPLLVYYLPFPSSHSMFYFDWTLPKGNISEQMHEKELMKQTDYALLIERGFTTFKRRPELQQDFLKYINEYANLHVGSWLKQMDVLNLMEAFVEPSVDLISFLRSFNRFVIDLMKMPETVLSACESTEGELLKALDMQLSGIKRVKPTTMILLGFSRIAPNFIGPKRFEMFWPHIKRFADYIIKKGFMVQFHLDNDYTDVLEFFAELPKGKTMYHLDLTNIFKAKEILGDRACLMGNIPPLITGFGTPQEVEKYCKNQIEGCMKGGGYMLCSACVLPDTIPAQNLKAMRDSVLKYGFYRR
ncbi:MAG TPA: uroporphyrinogen decarboxylase family protein [Candidatus Deferrimicrobium sp.]|nr:uroporphyrinogen decarboxylase family protein [Candidatus Deferrimicrobium sp.]